MGWHIGVDFCAVAIAAVVTVPWHSDGGLCSMAYRQWFLCHGILAVVTVQWHIATVVSVPCQSGDGFRAMSYRQWFLSHGILAVVSVPWHSGCGFCVVT